MTANLVLHWHLNALTPDDRAVDSSDNHLNGTVTGDPGSRPDERFGSVLDMGGTDVITVADTPLLRLSTYTVEAWVNPAEHREARAGIAGKPPADFRMILAPDGAVEHRFSTTESRDEGLGTGPGAVPPGTWRHVAIVNDGHAASIYLDGKLASVREFSGERTVEDVPFQVAVDYPGLLAHVRVYDGPLTDLEIQLDMADDEEALAAFVRAHPLTFSLTDVSGQAVLLIDDSPDGQPMTLELVNASRQDIELLPLDGPAAADRHHLALHFRPGTLLRPPEPHIVTPDWSLLADLDPANGGTVLYLASGEPLTILRGGQLDLALTGLSPDGSAGTRGTRVELGYQRMRYTGETDELAGQRLAFLDIVNHRTRRQVPLEFGFVGGNRVLNDGQTVNTLRIRIANLSRDRALPVDGCAFTISYDVQEAEETHEWALSSAGEAGRAELGHLQADGVPVNWRITRASLGQRVEWTLTPPAGAAFTPDGSLVATLSQVFALTSLGQAAITVGWRNVPGYPDGTAALLVEKSPLMFLDQRTGIGTVTPDGKLQVLNVTQDANGDTLVLGPAGGSNLRLGYHQDYTWIQSHGLKPLSINSMGNNVAIGTASNFGARLTIQSDDAHLQLRRDPSASRGKKVYLDLLQPAPAADVYPSLRFWADGEFWHRIEGRREGLMFKDGNLDSDKLVNIHADTALLYGVQNAQSSQDPFVVNTGPAQLRVTRQATGAETDHGKVLLLELYQGYPGDDKDVYPNLRFHVSSKFWHRIEGRPEGFMFKWGPLDSDDRSDIFARKAVVDQLQIGDVTIGINELRVLKKLADGQLEFDLYNAIQKEYAYAGDYKLNDTRRYVLTWVPGGPVSQGRWQIHYPR